MKVIHTIQEFRDWRAGIRGIVAFAPTMGALHEGHASLIRASRKIATQAGTVVSSIFVNPTQFGPGEDYTKYPRTLAEDLAILTTTGCDAVFVPTAEEMYPRIASMSSEEILHVESLDPGPLEKILEGEIRPGHFRGVCTVVKKLLDIVTPTHLMLGQKDYQQQAILRKMCKDLKLGVEVVTCPTIRERDGLAMSSRNRYLNEHQRPMAVGLFEALIWGKGVFGLGERRAAAIEQGMKEKMQQRRLQVQYAAVAHPETLELFTQREDGKVEDHCVLLVAAKLGATRLIDNMLLNA